MCLIIQATKPEVITENMMNCAYLNNDDGFGLDVCQQRQSPCSQIG
jgi:hypothetical protein